MNHEQLWNAIDRAAADAGMSVSKLAKKSGLDASAFNKSKRYDALGCERWPSTESLHKILLFLNMDLSDFADRYI